VLVEPDPREVENLRKRLGPEAILLDKALSDTAAELEFHLCRKQTTSSVHRPNLPFLKRFPDASRYEIVRSSPIQTETLDRELKRNGVSSVDFIKLDIQGHELATLKGAKRTLDSVIGLEIEVLFAPLYEEQPVFRDIDAFVSRKGFELFDLKRSYWSREKGSSLSLGRKGQLIFGDALYFRSPESLLESVSSEEKIIRAIAIYLAYRYLDLASTLHRKASEAGSLSPQRAREIGRWLARFERKRVVPDFRGRGRLAYWTQRFADLVGPKYWHFGSDHSLGNP
jgi:FkbM family methyltransferase